MSMSFEQIQKADAVIAKQSNSAHWSCSRCTFMNTPKFKSCQMCGIPYFNQSIADKYDENISKNTNSNQQDTYYNDDEYYDEQYYDDGHYEYDEYDDGAEYYDYDDIDWDSAKKRLIRTQLPATKRMKPKKKKKKETKTVSTTATTDSTLININSLNMTVTNTSTQMRTDNMSNTENKKEDENGNNIPGLKMIYDENKDSVQRIVIKTYNHPLKIRVMIMLNQDGYNNNNFDHKAWKLHTTGSNISYKKYNYLLSSCRIDIYDELTKKYWDSVTFLPCKKNIDDNRLHIINNASIPIFIKIRNNEYVEMDKRGIVRDLDTCILYYIGQYCLESRFKNIEWKHNKNAHQLFIPKMIENGIKWDIKMKIKNKNKDMINYKSPVYHRKLWKLFDKFIPNIHMLFHIIFEYLGYDRITNIMIEGSAHLNDITNDYFNYIAYSDQCIPKTDVFDKKCVEKVYENGIGYDVDADSLKMENGQIVKHYMNVAMDLNKHNFGGHLQRHSPFLNEKCYYNGSVWIPSQNPMKNIFKKSAKLKTIIIGRKSEQYKHRRR